MTTEDFRIQTLNEMLSRTISENIELVVKIKELNKIILDMKVECEILHNQYQSIRNESCP
jgi:hypothetical protein